MSAQRLRSLAGLALLAVPAAVWVGAAYEVLLADCEPSFCGDGDRYRGWFLLVLLTAPLIPLGLAVGRLPVCRIVRAGVAAVFCLLALGTAGLAVGAFVDLWNGDYAVNLDDPEGSERGAAIEVVAWVAGALFCMAIAVGVWVAGRRYP